MKSRPEDQVSPQSSHASSPLDTRVPHALSSYGKIPRGASPSQAPDVLVQLPGLPLCHLILGGFSALSHRHPPPDTGISTLALTLLLSHRPLLGSSLTH